MLYNPAHPPLMRPTLPGYLGLWRAGLDAASVNMAYATNAVGSGMPLSDFARIDRSQSAMVGYIRDEFELLTGDTYDYPKPHEFMASRFRHDILQRDGDIRVWIELAKAYPNRLVKWHEHAKLLYQLEPTVEGLVKALLNSRIMLATDRKYNGITGFRSNRKFADEGLLRGAKIIFENLIDNSVKYSQPDGDWIEVYDEVEPPSIVFLDHGIGMDPAFAARLGQGDQIREGRARGVGGWGIGWSSIARRAHELGWGWDVESTPGKGTRVTLKLKAGDLVEVDAKTMGPEARFEPDEMIPAERFVEGIKVFTEASPLAGYRIVDTPKGEMIDVTRSPIYGAILAAQPVLELLKKSLVGNS